MIRWMMGFCLLFFLFSKVYGVEVVRIIEPQSEQDASHHYFAQLLQISLDHTEKKYGQAYVETTGYVLEQGRAERALTFGQHIDVYWMGTSLQREQSLKAIRIPLLKGLLGYRGLIIREHDRPYYQDADNWEQLTRHPACQGMHWPDSDVLQKGAFRVVRSARYTAMFSMLANHRCDIFPRGIHEGPGEVMAYSKDSEVLGWFDDWLIYYPFPMYFFTNKDSVHLAERIAEGLELMIDDGSFEQFMKQHPVTQHLFPLDQWSDRVQIKLANPELPKDTPVTNTRYWLVPE